MRRYPLFSLAWLLLCPLSLPAKNSWGSFRGPLQVEMLPDAPNIELLADFIYTDPAGVVWLAPKGLVSDGASIPKAFWSIIGGPLDGNYRDAAFIDDEACDIRTRTWQATHLAFYDAMRCSGVNETKAKIMYFAVYHFGPRWGVGYETTNPQSSKSLSAMQLTSDTLNASSTDEAQAKASDIVRWVETNNPGLREIQNVDPISISAHVAAPSSHKVPLEQVHP